MLLRYAKNIMPNVIQQYEAKRRMIALDFDATSLPVKRLQRIVIRFPIGMLMAQMIIQRP